MPAWNETLAPREDHGQTSSTHGAAEWGKARTFVLPFLGLRGTLGVVLFQNDSKNHGMSWLPQGQVTGPGVHRLE